MVNTYINQHESILDMMTNSFYLKHHLAEMPPTPGWPLSGNTAIKQSHNCWLAERQTDISWTAL